MPKPLSLTLCIDSESTKSTRNKHHSLSLPSLIKDGLKLETFSLELNTATLSEKKLVNKTLNKSEAVNEDQMLTLR